jgi:hypothetical protein
MRQWRRHSWRTRPGPCPLRLQVYNATGSVSSRPWASSSMSAPRGGLCLDGMKRGDGASRGPRVARHRCTQPAGDAGPRGPLWPGPRVGQGGGQRRRSRRPNAGPVPVDGRVLEAAPWSVEGCVLLLGRQPRPRCWPQSFPHAGVHPDSKPHPSAFEATLSPTCPAAINDITSRPCVVPLLLLVLWR